MDSFKDKIAERFGTTDIIRANSQAEADELKNARARVEDLEKAVSDMRRLNLKCAETNELTNQVVAAAIEKIEETRNSGLSADASEELAKLSADMTALKESLEKSFKEQEENFHKENVRVYRNVQGAMIDELKQQSEAIAIQHMHIEKKVKGIKPVAIVAVCMSGIAMVSSIAMLVLYVINVYF